MCKSCKQFFDMKGVLGRRNSRDHRLAQGLHFMLRVLSLVLVISREPFEMFSDWANFILMRSTLFTSHALETTGLCDASVSVS